MQKVTAPINFDSGYVPPPADVGLGGSRRSSVQSSLVVVLEEESVLLSSACCEISHWPSCRPQTWRGFRVDGERSATPLREGQASASASSMMQRSIPTPSTRALKRVAAIYAQIRVRLRWTTTNPFTDDGKPLFDIVITNSAPVHAETTNSITRAVDGVAG